MSSIYIVSIIMLLLVVSYLIRLLGQRYSIIQRYLPVVNAVQFALWIIIVFWIIHNFFLEKSYYSILVSVVFIVLILLVTWFYVKDVIAGFLFRIKHNPLRGQVLSVGSIAGIIQKSGITFLTLEKADGEIIRMPYSTIANKALSIQSKDHQITGHVTISLKAPSSVSPALLEQTIRQTLAMSSWCVVSKSIDIEPDRENPGMTNISFYLVDQFYRQKAEKKLSQVIERLTAKKTK
jgi:small-conductance mechanosensitive channel